MILAENHKDKLIIDIFTAKINWHHKHWNSFPSKTDKVWILYYSNMKLIKLMGKNYRREMNAEWKIELSERKLWIFNVLIFPKMQAGGYERMHNCYLHGKSKLLLFVSQGQEYLFSLLSNLTAIIFSIPPLEERWVAKLETRHWVKSPAAFGANEKSRMITVSETCSQ